MLLGLYSYVMLVDLNPMRPSIIEMIVWGWAATLWLEEYRQVCVRLLLRWYFIPIPVVLVRVTLDLLLPRSIDVTFVTGILRARYEVFSGRVVFFSIHTATIHDLL